MQQKDIEIGETYLFVATDNPTRKHLEGELFTVEYKKAVWRKTGRKGSRKAELVDAMISRVIPVRFRP